MIKTKQVGSPCRLIYTMKNVLDNLGEVGDDFTKVRISLPAKNIHLETLAQRYARSIYGYYRVASHNPDDNEYLCYSTDSKVNIPSTIVGYSDGEMYAELYTNKTVDDSTLEL